MKKIINYSILIAVMLFSISKVSANWHRGFERRGYNTVVANRGYYRGGYNSYYNKGYYYNRPYVAYNARPVVAYNDYQYGPRRIGYYFYPGVNVYFNPFNHLYIYPFRGTWVTAAVLPRGFVINEPYRQVYCGVGENIWAYNSIHINTYRRGAVFERGYRGAPIRERAFARGGRRF